MTWPEALQPSAPRLPFFLSGLLVLVACSSGRSGAGNPAPAFTLEEATIESVHRVLASRRLTCRSLIEGYLRRIEAYNLAGPALTAIVTATISVIAATA